jgi:peptidyl-prolyl cis-trans isomerase C
MTRKLSLLFLPWAIGALALPCAVAAAARQTNGTPASFDALSATDRVVARGKQLEIRRRQLDGEVTHALAQAAANGREVSIEQMPSLERQVLAQLIDFNLLMAKATDAEKAAGKAAAEKRLVAARAKMGSARAFDLQLKLLATTGDELMAKWAEAFTVQAVLQRELKINITDQEARKFYEDNPKQFDLPETIRACHILIATRDPRTGAQLPDDQKAVRRKNAETVLKRVRAGEDFAILAMAFSNDKSSRVQGGEIELARGQSVPEGENAVFAMQTNQISDIVTSGDGYHIIKLREKIPALKVEYAVAAGDLKDLLVKQAIEPKTPDYVAKLRKDAGVEILDETLKPEEPAPTPIVAPDAPPPKSK